jgi:2-keto-3-deoxy-L-rhamnonate aldolase RhmA
MKKLKQRLQQGQTLHGCWLNTGSSLTAEIVGMAGFDWVLIDLEHGAGNEKDVLHQLQALEHTQAAPIVRVESSESQRIHRILDLGAEGIMCPKIANPEGARKLVHGLHYPPTGGRGVAKMVRATGFGAHFDQYYQEATDNILGIAQIETIEVLDHVGEIAAMDGIDVLFIGPADLSMELGIFGQFKHPLFLDAVNKTIHAAQKAGKATGILFFNTDDYESYHQLGIRFLACGSDATFVADGSRNLARKLDSLRQQNLPS